jgi:glycosyltransferase involved in cell wall biosynthesis
VGTDVVGIRDVIEPGETGLLVPHGDHRALADALVTVLDGDPLRDRLAENARRTAIERFDERVPARRVGHVYEELMARG